MKQIVLAIFFQLLVQATFSQSTDRDQFVADYTKMWKWMSRSGNYSFHLDYRSYKDHHSKDPYETASGTYRKSGVNYFCDVLGVKTVQNAQMKITIDSVEKLIILTKPQSLNPGELNLQQINDLMDNAKGIVKSFFGKATVYRIDFNKNELYEAVEYRFSNEGMLLQITYLYAEQVDRDYNDNGDMIENHLKPRLDICFSDYKQVKDTGNEFSEKQFLTRNGDKLIASGKFRGYEIKDYRFNSK